MATFVDPKFFNANGMGESFPPNNLFIEDRSDAFIVMRTMKNLAATVTGTGSMRATGQHTWTSNKDYRVTIDTAGYTSEATFKWSNDNGATDMATLIPVSDAYLGYYELEFGVKVQFSSDGVFQVGDRWDWDVIRIADQVYDLKVNTTTSTVQVGSTLEIVDSTFVASVLTGNPRITFDTSDYFQYQRSVNTLELRIASTQYYWTTDAFSSSEAAILVGDAGSVVPASYIALNNSHLAFSNTVMTSPGYAGLVKFYALSDELPYWRDAVAESRIALHGRSASFTTLTGTTSVTGGTGSFTTISGTVATLNSIVLQSAAATLTSLTRIVDISSTITLNYADPSLRGYIFRSTVEYQTGAGAGIPVPFEHSGTWKNKSGSAVNPAPMVAFADSGTVSADGQTLGMTLYRSFNSNPTVTRTNAGALTVTELFGFYAGGTVSTGSTVTTRFGVFVANPTVTGTIANNYGIYIESQTAGTTDYGIANLSSYAQSGWMNIAGTIATPANTTSGDFSAIRGNFGEDVAISGGAALTVRKGTLGLELLRLVTTATNDDPAERVFQQRTTTTDATVTTIATIPIPASTTVFIHAAIVARRTGGVAGTAEDGAAYIRYAAAKNVAGTATAVGAGSATSTLEDQTGWNATISYTGSDAIITVAGAVNNNVTWHVTWREYHVSS